MPGESGCEYSIKCFLLDTRSTRRIIHSVMRKVISIDRNLFSSTGLKSIRQHLKLLFFQLSCCSVSRSALQRSFKLLHSTPYSLIKWEVQIPMKLKSFWSLSSGLRWKASATPFTVLCEDRKLESREQICIFSKYPLHLSAYLVIYYYPRTLYPSFFSICCSTKDSSSLWKQLFQVNT